MANRFAHLALADSDSDTDAAPKANTVASAAAAPGTGAGEATQQQSAAPQVEKSDTVDSLPGGAQVAVGEPSKQAEGNQASQRELQKESMNTVTVPRKSSASEGAAQCNEQTDCAPPDAKAVASAPQEEGSQQQEAVVAKEANGEAAAPSAQGAAGPPVSELSGATCLEAKGSEEEPAHPGGAAPSLAVDASSPEPGRTEDAALPPASDAPPAELSSAEQPMLRGSNDACADNQQQQVPVKVEHSVSDAAVAVPTQPKEGSTKAESVPASQAAAANVNSTHSMEAERSTAEQVINSDAVEQQRTQSLPLESRSNPKTPKNDTRSRKSPEAGVVSSREPSAVPSLQRSMVGDKLQSGVRGKGTEATRGGESPSPQPTGAPSVDRQSSVVDDRAASSPSLNLPPKTGEDKCPENIKVDQGDAVAPDELGKVRDEHEESEHESRHAPDDCARIAEAEDSAAVEEGMEGNAEVVEVEDAGAAPKLAMPASALKRKIRVVDIPSHNLKSGASPRQNNGDAADGGKKKGRVVSRSGSNRRQRGQGHTGAQNRSKSTSGPKPLTHERGREKTSGAAVATGRQRSTSRKYFSRDPRDRPWLSNFDRNGCVSWNRSKGLSPERRSVSAGKYRTSVGIPPFSELTMSNVRRHAQQFPGARHPFANHGQSFSEESSQFRSCVSQDAMSLENACDILQMRLSKRLRYDGAREQRASMPSHQRQAKNMAEGGVRGRKTVDADVDNYVSKMRAGLKTDGRGRGPQPWPGRAGRPGTSGHPATARHSLSGPPGRRVIQPSRLEEELKLTFRPNISKYAHALPRNQVPCHQRLYTPRDVTPRRRTVGITDDQMPPPSSRVRELMDSMNCVLFQPNISRRAKAIENEKKFSDRLYPAKELERLRRDKARSQSPGCSPRRSPAISPHPSLRHTREVERAERSFRPAISPRARRMEYGEPFYERLYPCKESRMDEHDREANTPCNSPRQAAREGRAVSPRHSARPGRPSERAVPSFRPDISPRSEASRRSLFPYDWMHPSKAVTRGDAKGQASGHQFDIEFPRQRGGGGQGRSSHNEKERVKKSAIRAQNAPEEPTRTSRICANS